MDFRERAVTGFVLDADGTPILNARLKFLLTKKYGLTSDTIVIDRPFITTTDPVTGAFSQTLWCDQDSLIAVDYSVQFPVLDGADADTEHTATFSLYYEDGSPKPIGIVITESMDIGDIIMDPITLAAFIDQRIGTAEVNNQTGTAYTLQDSDAGKLVAIANAAAIAVTVPNTLPIGFQCLVSQEGAGQITFTGSSATVHNRQGHTKTAGRYAAVSITKVASGEFRLQGDTAA